MKIQTEIHLYYIQLASFDFAYSNINKFFIARMRSLCLFDGHLEVVNMTLKWKKANGYCVDKKSNLNEYSYFRDNSVSVW